MASKHTFAYTDSNVMLTTAGIILVGAVLGFMLELSEFLLLSLTSGLTLTIAGILKVGDLTCFYPISSNVERCFETL